MFSQTRWVVLSIAGLWTAGEALGATAGVSGKTDLMIASGGKSPAIIVVSANAGVHERQAAVDLAKYIQRMSKAQPAMASTEATIQDALSGKQPLLIVGQAALKVQPKLTLDLAGVLKQKPHLRSDGIVLRREGNRVYLAGNNDLSHYFAVSELLRRWGCRWYMPTEFGECIPIEPKLSVGALDHVHSSPFEIRTYWISWLGDSKGAAEFRARNMMNDRSALPPTGHALGKYTKGLGKGTFNFPITAPTTAAHVAKQIDASFAAGKGISLGMEDGSYDSENARDQQLMRLQWDKYFMRWSVTDPMLELYNNVAGILKAKHPGSEGKIGFLAYANMTLPPQREMKASPLLFCELAPIDIDPIHGMDDESPPRREYRDMMYRWAKVMDGRLCIYDYDQSMLVWRDIPNPSHHAFQQDVRHYRKAGILGVNTESRNAIGTTFLNLYLRGQLLWDPDVDVDALLEDFYVRFYGPAGPPMKAYWSAIFEAWENTVCTEHEYFLAAAIYTPEVMAVLHKSIQEAVQIINGIQVQARPLTHNEELYSKRMEFTKTSFGILSAYLNMVNSAAADVDYHAAASAGERGLKAREAMASMGGIFTTTKLERGAAWWPGEVQQYRDLATLTDGSKGTLIAKLPLQCQFRRDPKRQGLQREFHKAPVDMTYWMEHPQQRSAERKDYPDQWELIRSDLYAQAQGILHPDGQSFTGDMWYRMDLSLDAKQVNGAVQMKFPGLFNECWLYINGEEAAYREQGKLWWLNDYRFEWDVDMRGKLRTGNNTIALRCNCEHHFGGIFRRPFIYRAVSP